MGTGGSYARLLAWSENADEPLGVKRTTDADESWSIHATISEPVTFSAHGEGATIDGAAQQVIDQLRMVGVTID